MINSFGVIVRPNVPPDIRPPAVKIKIETDDDSDVEIIGQRGACIDMEHSQRISVTFTEKQAEQFRIFDKVRVVDKREIKNPATYNPNNAKRYVDLEVTHYIQYKDEFGHLVIEKFAKPKTNIVEGIFVMEENIRRSV